MTGLSTIEEKLIKVRENQVLLDRDVAFLYGVETKCINEAVKQS
ncbi:MAG: ORF6N domain-containing protein [Bacteroidetes bacterium]|nr:ORF6N domain-containing protein [Bacteroidota bacterium]